MSPVGIVPARGGSKGIPRKNLVDLGGRPLIGHTIAAALASRLERVFVSSEDEEILSVSRELGAGTIERPAALAGDATPAIDVLRHAAAAVSEMLGAEPEWLVYLQPTSPLRRAEDIDRALTLAGDGVDVVVSVVAVPHAMTPGSLMQVLDGRLVPLETRGAEVLDRHAKPLLYARNGPAVLAMRTRWLRESDRIYAGRTLPLVMPRSRSFDLDDHEDLEILRALLEHA